MTNARLVTASILLFIIGALIGFRSALWMFLLLHGPVLSQHLPARSFIGPTVFQLRTALLLGIHFAALPIALLICPSGLRRPRLAIAFIGLSALLALLVAVALRSDSRSMESLILQRVVTVKTELRATPFIQILLSGPLLILGIGAILRFKNRPL